MLAFMFRIRDVVTLINRCGITTQRPRASCCLLGLTFSNWNHWTGFLQYFCLIKNVFRQTEMADISTFKKINKNLNKYSNIIQLNGLGNMTHMYLLMKWSTGLTTGKMDSVLWRERICHYPTIHSDTSRFLWKQMITMTHEWCRPCKTVFYFITCWYVLTLQWEDILNPQAEKMLWKMK